MPPPRWQTWQNQQWHCTSCSEAKMANGHVTGEFPMPPACAPVSLAFLKRSFAIWHWGLRRLASNIFAQPHLRAQRGKQRSNSKPNDQHAIRDRPCCVAMHGRQGLTICGEVGGGGEGKGGWGHWAEEKEPCSDVWGTPVSWIFAIVPGMACQSCQ